MLHAAACRRVELPPGRDTPPCRTDFARSRARCPRGAKRTHAGPRASLPALLHRGRHRRLQHRSVRQTNPPRTGVPLSGSRAKRTHRRTAGIPARPLHHGRAPPPSASVCAPNEPTGNRGYRCPAPAPNEPTPDHGHPCPDPHRGSAKRTHAGPRASLPALLHRGRHRRLQHRTVRQTNPPGTGGTAARLPRRHHRLAGRPARKETRPVHVGPDVRRRPRDGLMRVAPVAAAESDEYNPTRSAESR